MHVIFDDDLHAQTHMHNAADDEQDQQERHQRLRQQSTHGDRIFAASRSQQDHQRQRQDDIGHGCQTLLPEVIGARLGRAKTAHFLHRGFH